MSEQQPDKQETANLLDPYFLALGKVAHAWNHLHEELGKLFCAVSGLELEHGMTIWHKLKSDRSQRDILQGATEARALEPVWTARRPKVAECIIDLLNETNTLAGRRNNAIHAPCSVAINAAETDFEIVPITFFGNDKAKRLAGKDILTEFKWYERCAGALKDHATACRLAVDAQSSSPDKPLMPTRGQADHQCS
jgi:hypothetical protein